MAENCIFCKIADGSIPARFVYEDKTVVGFEDLNPQAPQHILFIPRKHLVSMAELTPADNDLLGNLFMAANQVARERGLADTGYRFVSNVGVDGGQTVLHLHFHLLGGRKMTWPPG